MPYRRKSIGQLRKQAVGLVEKGVPFDDVQKTFRSTIDKRTRVGKRGGKSLADLAAQRERIILNGRWELGDKADEIYDRYVKNITDSKSYRDSEEKSRQLWLDESTKKESIFEGLHGYHRKYSRSQYMGLSNG